MQGFAKTTLDSGSLPTYPFTNFAAYAMPFGRETGRSDVRENGAAGVSGSNFRKRRWRVSHRLTLAEFQTMRDFYKAHLQSPFKFDDHINDIECNAVFTGTILESQRPGYYSVSVEVSEVV